MSESSNPRRHWLFGLVAGAALALGTGTASGQIAENVLPEQLENWRIATGDTIRYCHYPASPTAEFERALGEEIASRLLLASSFQSLPTGYGIDGQFFFEDLFIQLTNDCDIALGLAIEPGFFPVEFTVLQPYANFGYVLVVTDPSITGLRDIPRNERIGTEIGSRGETRLASYILTLPRDQQWQRLPYGDPELMLTRLLDGTISGMVLYGPTFARLRQGHPDEELHVLSLDPVQGASINVGGALLAERVFLRAVVDPVIGEMIEDGTIMQLLEEHGLADALATPGAR